MFLALQKLYNSNGISPETGIHFLFSVQNLKNPIARAI